MDNLKGTVHCIECKRLSKMLEEMDAELDFTDYRRERADKDNEKLCKAAVFCIRKWLGGDRMTDHHVYWELWAALPDWYKERERAGMRGIDTST